VIRVYSDAGNVIETQELAREFKDPVISIISQTIHAICDLVNVAPSQLAENSLDSRLRVCQLLKARIIPKRIEHGIEPEQRWSEGDVRSQWVC